MDVTLDLFTFPTLRGRLARADVAAGNMSPRMPWLASIGP
ncbi:hypothetical protein Z950_3884 [Sulfitobacter mediterraneus KCTC 32188]|nr:hypothetical protein Z950_3884 [Sulfitobacter mediterraneus KCTC 32188]